MNFNILITSAIFFIFLGCASTIQKNEEKKEIKNEISKENKEACIKQLKYYKILSSQLDNKATYRYIDQTDYETHCTDHYEKTLEFMQTHDHRIGVILEESDENRDKNLAILLGIKESLKKLSGDTQAKFVIKKVPLKKRTVNLAFSQLVIKEKVGLIITWGQQNFIEHIQNWQKGLNLPTLYISNKIKKTENSFRVFPSRKNYQEKLIETLKEKNIKKVAILSDFTSTETAFMKLMRLYLKKHEIEVVYDVGYNKGDFTSYDMACRKIFEIDRFKRQDEFRAIMAEEKYKAKKAGFKLNPKLVFLPAKTDYDAIIIPDDFQTVHYFTKLFKYYQANNITLIGNYQWRSQDLLRPKEEFLEGATFIDFMGDYNNLPFEVDLQKNAHDMNTKLTTDYKLMGYYSGLISQLALKQTEQNRENVFKKLKEIKIKDSFLGKRKVFDDNQFNWPSFKIEISNNEFVIQK